jgi:hypothetical protein
MGEAPQRLRRGVQVQTWISANLIALNIALTAGPRAPMRGPAAT